MINKSESIKNIALALVKFHSLLEPIKKTDINPFFKNAYAGLPTILSAIDEPLGKAGLSLTQFPIGENELSTLLMHGESGEWLEGTFKMNPIKNDPQGQGSVISYQRRYALGAVLQLNIDIDNDGNENGNKVQSKTSKPLKSQNLTPREASVAYTPTETDINQIVPGTPVVASGINYYFEYSEKIRNAKTSVELEGYAENLKYYSKLMKPNEKALLRSQFAKRRKELTPEEEDRLNNPNYEGN